MTAIEGIRGWGYRHRKPLLLLLIAFLIIEIALGFWIKGQADITREELKQWHLDCTGNVCTANVSWIQNLNTSNHYNLPTPTTTQGA